MVSLSSISSSFQSIASMTPLDKVTQTATQISGMVDSALGLASSMSSQLQSAGMSLAGIGSSVTSQVDGIVGGGDPHYAAAGKATNRTSQTNLTASRVAAAPDVAGGNKYSVQVSPQGKISSAKTVKDAANLDFYPPDLGRYYMQLDFADYQRPSPFANTTMQTQYTVLLPIPANLVESYDLNWQTMELGLIGDIVNAVDGGGVSGSNLGSAALRAVGNLSPESAIALEQTFGVTPNPNVTAAFKGIQLRQHTFAWTFAPKTPDESKKIQKIVREIRKRILPGMNSGSTALLGYPCMVRPSVHPLVDSGGGRVPLYEFKKCVVPKLNVSYSPTGVPSFFKGTNLPTFVQLALVLLEIEYFTVEDNAVGVSMDDVANAGKKLLSASGDLLNKGLEAITPGK